MNKEKFSFNLLKEDSSARVGKILTQRGEIDTPTFMTVGTQATIKSVFMEDIILSGAQIILSNTYHLMIRPGAERIKRIGGLHKFMNCKLPILTDSGGFQIMSLSKLVKIDDKIGAIFNSHIDGKKFTLTPEKSIKIQKDLNSDIVMVLDECPKMTTDKNKLTKFDFDGYALGGLAVGETQKQMFKVLDNVVPLMPKYKPRYLMGVGTPSDILGAVKRGIDMFDCVLPTRSGRTGLAFTWKGRLNLRNSKYKNDDSPIDKDANLRNLNNYSKSYINHLINSNEILASMILTLNNILFYQQFMKKIREAIKNNSFNEFYNKYINLV